MEMKNKVYIIWFLIVLGIFYIFIKNWVSIKSILSPFFVSILMAYLLNPFVRYFTSKGFTLTFSILTVFFIVAAAILIFSYYVFPILIGELASFVKVVPEYLRELNSVLNHFKFNYLSNLPPNIENAVEKNLNALTAGVTSSVDTFFKSAVGMLKGFVDIVIIPILTFYFLKDKDIFLTQVECLIPLKYREKIFSLLFKVDRILSKYLRAQVYLSIFVGALTGLGLALVKVRYAFLLGVIAGILNIIPYIGPILSILPAVAIGLMDSIFKGLWAFAICLLIQQVENVFVTPKVMGDSVGLHPVTVIFALLLGEELFGVWGLLFSVPVAAILKEVFTEIFLDK
ncbi:MAG: AI-2E family transporter [Caldanaerobacter subterraneus]|nr:AI-2E family transporter [Caldanaerobacter subterraneus]